MTELNKMDLNNISKYISLILRHKPETIGITLDEHGWSSVCELVDGIAKTNEGFNINILKKIVSEDSKQRYSFNEDYSLIRANQGHSINVDVELKEVIPPEYLYHGTGEKYTESIDQNGLIKKSRLYVHLSKDSETAITAGKRHGKPVMYIIFSGEMYRRGFKFFLSENEVYLTDNVPVKYMLKTSEGKRIEE